MSTVATCPDDEPRSERLTRAIAKSQALRASMAKAMEAQSLGGAFLIDEMVQKAIALLATAERMHEEEVTAAAKEGKEPS